MIVRHGIKKTISLLCALGVVFALSGCTLFDGILKSTKNFDELTKMVKEGNFVEEWEGKVPDGMKVKYLLVKDIKVNYNDNKYEYEYEYDKKGRPAVYKDIRQKGYIRYEIYYNSDDLVSSKKMTHDGYVGSAPTPDLNIKFEYNDSKKLVAYTYTVNGKVSEYHLKYDLEGHLISLTDYDNAERKYDFNFEKAPYHEYVAVVKEDFDVTLPQIVKRTYDEDMRLLSESTDDYTKTYEYDGEKLTGYTNKNRTTETRYDADGKILSSSMGDGREVTEYRYNDRGDQVYYTMTRDGEVTFRKESSYEYDSKGNMISRTDKIMSKSSSSGEKNYEDKYKFTYDERGLLVTEEERKSDGGYSYLRACYYKAKPVSDNG